MANLGPQSAGENELEFEIILQPNAAIEKINELLNTLNNGILGTGTQVYGDIFLRFGEEQNLASAKFTVNARKEISRPENRTRNQTHVLYRQDLADIVKKIIQKLSTEVAYGFINLTKQIKSNDDHPLKNVYKQLLPYIRNPELVTSDYSKLIHIVALLAQVTQALTPLTTPIEEQHAPEQKTSTAKVVKPSKQQPKSKTSRKTVKTKPVEQGPYERRLRDQAAWLQGLALYEFFTQNRINLDEVPEALRNQILSEAMLLLNGLTPEEIMALVGNPALRVQLLQKLMRRLQQNPYFMTRLELFYNQQHELRIRADAENGTSDAKAFQTRIVAFVDSGFTIQNAATTIRASIDEQVLLRGQIVAEFNAILNDLVPSQDAEKIEELKELLELMKLAKGSKSLTRLLQENPNAARLLQTARSRDNQDFQVLLELHPLLAERLEFFSQSLTYQAQIENPNEQEQIIAAGELSLDEAAAQINSAISQEIDSRNQYISNFQNQIGQLELSTEQLQTVKTLLQLMQQAQSTDKSLAQLLQTNPNFSQVLTAAHGDNQLITTLQEISEPLAQQFLYFVEGIQIQESLEHALVRAQAGDNTAALQIAFVRIPKPRALRVFGQERSGEAFLVAERQAVVGSFDKQLESLEIENPELVRKQIEEAIDRLILAKAPIGFSQTLDFQQFNQLTGLELSREQFQGIKAQLAELELNRLSVLHSLTGGKASAQMQVLAPKGIQELQSNGPLKTELQAKVFGRVGELDEIVNKTTTAANQALEQEGQKPIVPPIAVIAAIGSGKNPSELSPPEREEIVNAEGGLVEFGVRQAIYKALEEDKELKQEALRQALKDQQRAVIAQKALTEIEFSTAPFAFSTPKPRVELGPASEHSVVQSPYELVPETRQVSPLKTVQNLFRRQKPDSVTYRAALSTAEAKPRSPIPNAFSRFLRKAKEQKGLAQKVASRAKKQARNRMIAWITHMIAQFLVWLAQIIMTVAAAIAGAIATFAAVLATGAALLTALAVAGLVAGAIYLGLKYGRQVISAASSAAGDALSWTGRQIKSAWNGAKNTINRALRPSSTAEASVGGGGALGTSAGQTAVISGGLGATAIIVASISSPFLQPLPTITGDEVSPYVEIEKVVVDREAYTQTINDWPTTVHYRVAIKAKDNYTLTIPVSSISDVFRISQSPEPWEDAGLPVPNPSAPSDKGFTDLQTSSGCTGDEPDYSEGNLDSFLSEDESELVIEPGEILLFPSYCHSFDENYNHSNIENYFSIEFDYNDGEGDLGSEEAFTGEGLCFGECPATQGGCWPVSGIITQLPLGTFSHDYIDDDGIRRRADAYDITVNWGEVTTPVYTPFSGVVRVPPFQADGFGHYVVIDTDISGTGQGESFAFAHLKERSPLVSGEHVEAGAVVGMMGNTGWSKGTHLHYEIRNDDGLFNSWPIGQPLKLRNFVPEPEKRAQEQVRSCYDVASP